MSTPSQGSAGRSRWLADPVGTASSAACPTRLDLRIPFFWFITERFRPQRVDGALLEALLGLDRLPRFPRRFGQAREVDEARPAPAADAAVEQPRDQEHPGDRGHLRSAPTRQPVELASPRGG